jgi:hypothetical protein
MKPTLHPVGDLGEVFRLHRVGLVRLAAFIVGDRGTGEDVVQDVFVRMHQRGHPVDGDLLPYLRAAVVNTGGVPDTGFALTASYMQADAKAAASATAAVSTQGCEP